MPDISAYSTDEIGMEEFDLNDPQLLGAKPAEVDDVGAEPVQRIFAPSQEGNQWVLAFLRPEKDDKPSVCLKRNKDGSIRVQANLVVRTYKRDAWGAIIYNEDGRPQAADFVRDWYPSTMILPGQGISELGFVMKVAGKFWRPGMNFGEMIEHVKNVFAEAGDGGIAVPVFLQWIINEKEVDDNGMPVYGKDDKAVYREIRGAQRIKGYVLKEASKRARDDAENADAIMKYAAENPHVYFDKITGEPKCVQTQVARVIPVIKADQAEEVRSQASIHAQTEAATAAAGAN